MKKVLVTGASGLLAHELIPALKDAGFSVLPYSHQELDITDKNALRQILTETKPDIFINTAGVVNIDRAEEDPGRAYLVNRDAVGFMLETFREIGLAPLFVQISSTEVFGRWNEGECIINGYTENDEPKPISVYQKSKAEAEVLVRKFDAEHPEALRRWYVVRASWLFGEGRTTFVNHFRKQLTNREELMVAEGQWRNPTWTRDFARALVAMVKNEPESGIYHIANTVLPGEATVAEVVEEIRSHLSIAREDVHIKRVNVHGFFKTPRAPSGVLLNTKLEKLRPWREALHEYLQEMDTKSEEKK